MQKQHSDMIVRRKYKRYLKQKMTYLGLIAYVIQNTPEKRVTFCELMNAIMTFVDGDKKGVESSTRACLSINGCFVKVSINIECSNLRRNFWKLDKSKITPKMLRRHFSGMRDIFPELYENTQTSSSKKTVVKNSNDTKAEKKFISSFSIESILQRDSSAPTSPVYFPRNFTNVCSTIASTDSGLACKRKTWDYSDQIECADFRRSYSHFSFPSYSLDQMNERCSSINHPSKRIYSASELSYNCPAFENIRQFTSDPLSWAYM